MSSSVAKRPGHDDAIRNYARRVVDAAPPLTDAQRAQLAMIFRPKTAAKKRQGRNESDRVGEQAVRSSARKARRVRLPPASSRVDIGAAGEGSFSVRRIPAGQSGWS